MFIGGAWREASDGRTIDVLNPATEEVIAQVPNASDADLDDALAAAATGFALWRRTAPTERADVLLRDEPFGPIMPILPFGDIEDGLAQANAVPYGLAAYVFTSDLERADTAVAVLEAGMIGVNEVALAAASSPFGGVKLSGYGREGGTESLEAYTVATAVTTKGAP